MDYKITITATLLKTESFDFKGNKYYKVRIMENGDIMDISVKNSPALIAEIDNLKSNDEYTFVLSVNPDNQFKPKVQVLEIK